MIPFSAVENFDQLDSVHLRVRAQGQWFRAWGVEKSNITLIAGAGGVAGKVADRIQEGMDSVHLGSPGEVVQVWVRRPEWPEILLSTLWVTYIVLGAVLGP